MLSQEDKKTAKKNYVKSMVSLQTLKRKYSSLEKGPAKVALIEQYVELADKIGNPSERLEGRYELVWAYQFGGDPAKALPVITEYLTLAKEQKKKDLWSKIAISSLTMLMFSLSLDLPQISKEQCTQMLEKAKETLDEYNIGERFYESSVCRYYFHFRDEQKLKEHIEKFLSLKRDFISDCNACEISNASMYMMVTGQRERALNEIKRLLQEDITCSEQPWLTISMFIREFLSEGNISEAKKLGHKLYTHPIRYSGDLQFAAALMHLEAITKENKWADIVLFENCINMVTELFHKVLQFDFYLGAWCFSKYLASKSDEVKLSLSPSFPLYSKNSTYNCEKLAQYFMSKSEEIGNAFDKRSKNDTYKQEIEKVKKSMSY